MDGEKWRQDWGRDSENRGGDGRWMGLNSKRLLLCLCVLLVEPDTESNSALSLYWHTHTDTNRRTDTHTGHKHLSLFLASAGWCLAEEIKPNNRGICLSSRRVPPPHPHMTCPAFIHWAACCQPQDGPLPPPLPATPLHPGLSALPTTLCPRPCFPPRATTRSLAIWLLQIFITATLQHRALCSVLLPLHFERQFSCRGCC